MENRIHSSATKPISLLSGYQGTFNVLAMLFLLPSSWYVLQPLFGLTAWQSFAIVGAFPIVILIPIVIINIFRRLHLAAKYLGYPYYRKVLLVGATDEAATIISETMLRPTLDMRVVGVLDDFKTGEFNGVPILGTTIDILKISRGLGIDDIIIAERGNYELVSLITRKARWLRANLHVTAEPASQFYHAVQLGYISSIPVLTYAMPPKAWAHGSAKRLFDITVAVTLLIALAPLFLLIALAIRIESPGNIFVKSTRMGRKGRTFTYYKFRTMHSRILRQKANAFGPAAIIQLMKQEHNLTRVGARLRSMNFDSLPQLFNILRGDMSLIGPRPLPPKHIQQGDANHHKRQTVRPGMVGPAQIRGKTLMPTDAALRWDVWYVENNSFALDVKLLLQSFYSVFRGVQAEHFHRLPVLGVGIHSGREKTFLRELDRISVHGNSAYVCFVNVHMLMETQKDPEFAAMVNNCDVACPDGAPVARAVGWFYGLRQRRMPGPGTMPKLMKLAAEQGKKIFVLGGKEEVLKSFVQKARETYPGIQMVGYNSPPFRPITEEEDQAIVDQINDSRADFVFVALGCPKQEKWMATHKGRIKACMYGLGFAIPAFAGHEKRAPEWVQAIGMEWFHRLLSDPKRLLKRYWETNTGFIATVIKAKLGSVRN